MNTVARQNHQEACLLEDIRQLPATAEGVALGIEMLGEDSFQNALESSLHFADGQHVVKWNAANTDSCLHFSCTSDGPAGRSFHDLYITERFRPFPEEVICLLGKMAYSH